MVRQTDLYELALATEPPDRRRFLPTPSPAGVVDFSTNDYLSFSRHPQLSHAATRAMKRYGLGATGSRLLSGNTALHEVLERRIARDLGTEAALLFPSGYQLNVAVLAALLDRKTVGAAPQLYTDRLLHASLHHGAQLAGVREQRFRHNDLEHLEHLLQAADPARPRFIVTESLYGMDGDISDVARLCQLATTHEAVVCIDDSHALGVYGTSGFGLLDSGEPTVRKSEDLVILGTLSKALGGLGGYVACSQVIKDYLIQKCGGFIYSTALAPPLVAAAWAAWRQLPACTAQRIHIHQLGTALRRGLKACGLNYGNSLSHIIPIVFGDEQRTLQMKKDLLLEGFLVSAIRPPTVPLGAARLRLALCAHHRLEDISAFLAALQRLV